MCDKDCSCVEDPELVECCSVCGRRRRYALIIFSLAMLAFILFLPLGDPAKCCLFDANKNHFCLRFSCAVHKFMSRITTAIVDFVWQLAQIIIRFLRQLFEGAVSIWEKRKGGQLENPCAVNTSVSDTIDTESVEICTTCKQSKDSCYPECPDAAPLKQQ